MILQVLGVFDVLKNQGEKEEEESSLEYYLQRLDELQNDEFNVLINVGVIYLESEEYENSLKYFEKALRMSINLKDDELEAFVLDSIGDVYLNTRKIIKSLEYYNESLRIYASNNSPLVEELQEKIKEVEKIKEAIELSELEKMKSKSSSLSEEDDHETDLSNMSPKLDDIVQLVESASIYETYSNEKDALIHLSQAFRISKEIGDTSGEAALLLIMGNENLKQKKYDEAEKCLENSKSIFKRLGDESGLAGAMIILGTVNFIQGNIEGVSENFRKAVEKFQQLDNKKAESAAIDILNTLYNE
ncbi:MAG: tetratricopeptide repeat protein [Methanobacteriaceae archaeon]|jgi:tetratricopeptide (TPR) repeat protein|nr:tetratricopeptide repeat protein [Methanobacteriaceae archaeon]MDO9626258.1 tetratricopeptide repeat protein [Methanobacteriaceae archaeon]